jgi:transposase
MNGRIFETWIETQLAPTLSPGDVVILDNVAFHKSPRAEELVKAQGAWLLSLPAYSPDLNPIEMVFSKLKTLLRKWAARSFDAITQALGDICDLFPIAECRNFFTAAGYGGIDPTRFKQNLLDRSRGCRDWQGTMNAWDATKSRATEVHGRRRKPEARPDRLC